MTKLKQTNTNVKAKIDKKVEEDFFALHLRILRLDGLFETLKLILYDPDSMRFLDQVKRIQHDLGWISIIVTILGFPLSFYKLFYELTLSDAKPANRLFNISMLTLGVGISFLMLFAVIKVVVIATPILFVAGSAKGVFESFMGLAFAIKERFSKSYDARKQEIENITEQAKKTNQITNEDLQRLTQLKNEKNNASLTVGFQLHSLSLNLIGLAGSAMLFFPATAPIGAGLLLGLGAYGVFQLSVPILGTLSKRIFGRNILNIFASRSIDHTIDSLCKRLGKNISVIPSPTPKRTSTPPPSPFLSTKANINQRIKRINVQPTTVTKRLLPVIDSKKVSINRSLIGHLHQNSFYRHSKPNLSRVTTRPYEDYIKCGRSR